LISSLLLDVARRKIDEMETVAINVSVDILPLYDVTYKSPTAIFMSKAKNKTKRRPPLVISQRANY
jgi:hypothetical protein